jgi:Fur family ferric uptake transcriptional regulator
MRPGRKGGRLGQEARARALDRFRHVLRERALKSSRVREAVARAALGQTGHFTVEDLLSALREGGVNEAHMATVYRAIPLLLEAGLIQPALVLNSDSQHYEVVFEREHHDHLVCTNCGRVVEYQSAALLALQRKIAARYEFTLDEQTSELHGRCKSCRRASPENSNSAPVANARGSRSRTAAVSGSRRSAQTR